MADSLRLWFVVFYAVGVVVLLVKVVPAFFRGTARGRRVADRRRYLPVIFLPLDWLLPPILILLRVGELEAQWVPVRATGFLLSVYAALMLLWTTATLGRFLVPQAVVFPDHALATNGPFRIVRHPAYSGDLALWLGAALGTLNVPLLVLWPLAALGSSVQARSEEELLEARFRVEYEAYAQRTPRFVPWLPGRRGRRPPRR